MILNYENTCEKISNFVYVTDALPEKDEQLERAVRASVVHIKRLAQTLPIHLSLSGGVDSTVVLYLLSELGIPIVAHTICAIPTHPDVVHARLAVEELNSCNVTHLVHTVQVTEDDLQQSNRILQHQDTNVDNYYMLLKTLKPFTDMLVNCDCIDELLGGYYQHQRPDRSHWATPDLNTDQDRKDKLIHCLSRLIPDHLSVFQTFSGHFDMTIYLPYSDPAVLSAAARFSVSDLVDGQTRKKPMLALARRLGVPEEVVTRKKFGLCSALDQ